MTETLTSEQLAALGPSLLREGAEVADEVFDVTGGAAREVEPLGWGRIYGPSPLSLARAEQVVEQEDQPLEIPRLAQPGFPTLIKPVFLACARERLLYRL